MTANQIRSFVLDAAIRRYARDCRADSRFIFQQPCSASSGVTHKYVTLRNVRGQLARYAWTTKPVPRRGVAAFQVILRPA